LPSAARRIEVPRRAGARSDFIKSLEKQFGFDKPAPERFAIMLWNTRGSISARVIFAM